MTLDLRERIIEFAAERHRFDYWRLHIPLRRESWQVNRKTVHCITVKRDCRHVNE